MQQKVQILVALATLWASLAGAQPTVIGPANQRPRQQLVIAAQQAAAQAALYARQAAVFTNAAARQAAYDAAQAAAYAKGAADWIAHPLIVSNTPISVEQCAAYAEQAAANARQAAGKAEVDAMAAKLAKERDDIIEVIIARYAPGIADLEAKIAALKEKDSQLRSQANQKGSDPQLTKQLNDNQKELAELESKLRQLDSDFDKETQPLITEYQTSIKDVPQLLAKRTKPREDANK
jgi:cell fate (sporulation/competence/biofilm development) regulator YmcA (YheA/YmcA/DUF963 family)